MKTVFRYLVSVAAFIAVFGNVFADDAPLIVMDKAYYEATASGFYTSCASLMGSVNSAYTSYNNTLDQVNNSYLSYERDLGQLRIDIQTAKNLIDYSNPDYSSQELALNQALSRISTIEASIDDQQSSIQSAKNQLYSDRQSIVQQVNAVSNSFPTAITDTNLTLNVYVVVTNNFDFATNQFDQAQNTYTNFLNYYRNIIDDSVLDPYRATVTNLLDWSILKDVINSSYWTYQSPTYNQDRYKYFNYDFTAAIPLNNTGIFPVAAGSRYYWGGRGWVLGDSASDIDFLMFSIQGLHDSVEQSAYLQTLDYTMLVQASTNRAMSLSTANGQTNEFARFLHAPDSYDKQVAKIATTRNWYQRIEHWLSAIAHNTDNGSVDINDETRNERENEVGTVTNDVAHSVTSAFEGFEDVGESSTNSIAKIQGLFTDNLASVFNHFLVKPKGSKAGGNDQPAAQRFKKLYFMETSWVNSRLSDLTKKPNDVPDYVVLQDIEHGEGSNTVWSLSLKAADITHNVFGVLWSLIGFGLSIYECIMLSKFFVNIWWRLLKWLPNVNRYVLGS